MILEKAFSMGLRSGRVGREIPKPCADGLEHRAQGLGFVAAEIVEDDDVSSPQGRQEELFDIGARKHWPLIGPSKMKP